MNMLRSSTCAMLLLTAAVLPGSAAMVAAQERVATPVHPPVATTPYRIGNFAVRLRSDTQTLASLRPDADPAFDFVPAGREAERAGDGYVHLGDLHLRLRTPDGEWRDFASARQRRPIRGLPLAPGVVAAADITATMGDGIPLTVERQWIDTGGMPVLRFVLANPGTVPVEVGAMGMPMVFDNIITDRSLDEAHAQASFVDPYIGRDAGYLQVTRLNGAGPALLVLPEAGTPLEAWRPIPSEKDAKGQSFTDRSPRGQTSEGFYDWTVASAAYASREWAKADDQWNRPTGFTLAPGERRSFGVRLVQSPTIRAIETTLAANARPVAIGVPGYVVPTDLDARLFVKAPQPIARITVEPADAMTLTRAGEVNGWQRIAVRGNGWGRARVSIGFADGSVQTVSYFVTKPLDRTMADLGRFATTKQWFEGAGDPFGRSPAILTYDNDAKAIVTQEPRVWIAGMSDEGGGGSWVAAMMKQLDHPDAAEVAKLERMVDETVAGRLQVEGGPSDGAVRKSLFYYDPALHPGAYDPAANWTTWTSWSKKDANDLGRAYNYPHVAIGHWVLYRTARNHPGLVTRHDWRWYLDRAYATTVAMMRDAPHYAQFGLMEGDVFLDILRDLKREGMTAQATAMEALMRGRADHWKALKYPFGSEMAWDSTGQPEVYAWMRYFGHQPQADTTREVILGYDPTIPHWGYNGNARRYWDFLYGGKVPRIERQIHHYGSTLNAVPLFDAFRADPADLHLLRVAYGGLMGGITNIDRDGFSSAAFHAAPDMLKWDAYSGDYGMGLYGHAIAAATYVVNDPTFGWLAYGGNLAQANGALTVMPKDGARSRLFIAPAKAWITLAAGKIASARYVPATGAITLTLDPADAHTPAARLMVEASAPDALPYRPVRGVPERGGYTIALGRGTTTVELRTGARRKAR
ncbi:DUF5695 domain-containing protein [Sphingomonas sp. Leaf25]|uniref:DUF5695 domain-containing protein n=1 Tax=Sphingomonas sp. Leaf25 TaxID=1735692 RepID=UPI0006F26164|nr:DUF5695 domain-containing protein [Sphingomonas sp. Leaf25]KQN06955.1 hypothetical protein ASE78_15160 [Sphingomonas sp. Leaf25]